MPSPSAPIAFAKNVRKNFGSFTALHSVSFEVNQGECLGLLGPNGAGKSTMIGLLYGAAIRTSGDLKVFGFDPTTHAKEIKRRLGVVPQENALDEALSVEENMRLFGRFVGLSAKEATEKVAKLLEYMSLDHKREGSIRALSGGMKRRLAFVRALLANPDFLILDEPTTGLDPAVRHLLWERVADLRNQNKTVLVSTHYMHEAEVLCDRIVVMNKGEIVDVGSPRELIRNHTPGFVGIFTLPPEKKNSLTRGNLQITNRGQSTFVRAPSMDDLLRLQTELQVEAAQLRPANLEDVFLKITGEELNVNA